MAMKQNIRTFLVLFLLFSLAGLAAAFWAKNREDEQQREQTQQQVEGVRNFSGVPEVINVAPIEAVVGQEYSYKVSIVDSDTETSQILLGLVDAPEWMFKRGREIYGTPGVSDIGTYEVTYTISDGENIVTESFYVVVQSDEEPS